MRNAYDVALRACWPGGVDWTDDPTGNFPRCSRSGVAPAGPCVPVDVNAKSRDVLTKARLEAGGASATPCKIVAELNFGFWRYLTIWRYLTDAKHEKHLWGSYLHHASPPAPTAPPTSTHQ